MLNFDNFNGLSYQCECGAVHTSYTDIIAFGKGASVRLAALCKAVAGESKVALCACQDVAFAADKLAEELTAAGVRTIKVRFAPETPPSREACEDILAAGDDVRLIVGVGGGAMCDIVRYAATLRECEFIYVMSAPTTDSVLYGVSLIDGKLVEAKPPKALICDFDFMTALPDEATAAGYGEVVGKYLLLFEDAYRTKCYKKGACGYITRMLGEILEDFERDYRPECATECVCYALIRLGLVMQMSKEQLFCGAAEDVVALMRRADVGLSDGVNKMLAFCALESLYRTALRVSLDAPSIAPDLNARLYVLAADYGFDTAALLKCNKGYGNLLKDVYVYNEYREDLAAELEQVEARMSRLVKNFRRIFDDAGFRLGGSVSVLDILRAIEGASLLRDGTLLSFLGKTMLISPLVEAS